MSIGFNVNKTEKQKQLQIPVDFRHCLILGETGSGKTASIITPIMLERMKKNHGILVFDFKGNYHYTIKTLAKKKRKLQSVIELGKDYGSFTNIIEGLPVEALDKILRPLLGHDIKDKFWEESAIQLGVSILAIIKYMNELVNNYKYPYSFKTLIEIESDAKKIKNLKKEVKKTMNKILNSAYNYSKELNIIKIILEYYKTLDKVADDFSLDRMIDDNEKTVLHSVISTLINPIASLREDSVNIPEIDILKELCNGKIVVFSLNDFDQNVLNAIVSAVFYKIILFKMSYKDTPMSIIMDEAQKVLNNYFELPLDVLREYKVDVVLATQSIANLKEKLNLNKVEALLANLTHKIYLNGQDMKVPKYKAYYNNEYYKLTPIEFSKLDKFLAERDYQMNYTKLKDLSFFYNSIPVVYSKLSDTKLLIKDQNLRAIGEMDFFIKKYTKEDLAKLFPDILKLKDEINQSRAIEEYLRNESYKGGDYDYY